MSDNKSSKNFMFFPEWGWMIIVGLLLAILVLMDVVPGKASELSGEIIESSYVLDSISDSGILSGSDRLVLAYDKYYNPSGNPTGSLSLTYPMSAGSSSSWTGTWTRTGFSRTEFSVVQGFISNLDDSAHRVYISQDNWVQSLNLKSLNKEDDSVGVLYFDSFNNIDLYGYYAIETFGVQTSDLEVFISDNIIQVQGDAALYKWVSGSWVLVSSVISQNLMNSYPVSTVVKSDFLSVKLDGGSSVDIMCSSFSLDSSSNPVDPSPSPSPEPQTEYILVQFNGYWLFDFEGLGIADPVVVPVSSYLQELQSQFASTDNVAKYSTDFYGLDTTNSRYFWAFFLNYSFLDSVKVYYSWDQPSDLDVLRSTVTPTSLTIVNKDDGSSAFSQVYLNSSTYYILGTNSNVPGTLYLSLQYRYNGSVSYSLVSMSDKIASSYNKGVESSKDFRYPFLSAFGLYKLGLEYRIGFDSYDNPFVTPSPSPSPTPEPTPSATPIPTPGSTIIIVTPVPVTPTPFLDVNIPSSPGGDLDGDTTDGILSTGFEFIRTGGSPGLLSTAFSFVPDELQYLIWFLIFLLIILATLKLILHFGG